MFKLLWVLFWSCYLIGFVGIVVFSLKNLLFSRKRPVIARAGTFLAAIACGAIWPLYVLSQSGRKFLNNTVNFK